MADDAEALRRAEAERDELAAVLERVKQHIGLWRNDRRLRIAGEILLRDIARFEDEERARRR